ncbi:MAG TPA: hypothetical protein VHQ65_01675 [Thermoanaerobaculia bacterium]|nr:hypothetical protein [Thermoanaerobaculia bacterium]
MNGNLQPYEWALRRLVEEFGAEAVRATASPAGDKVAASIAAPAGDGGARVPYVVILCDPVLGDANRLADPPAFLAGEIRFAREWIEGKGRRSRTFG